jgi:hypothetical protein
MICDSCREEFIKILDQRMRDILSHVTHMDDNDPERLTAQAQCFQLMDMQRAVRGEPVAFGPAVRTVDGPLFKETK